MQLSPQVRRELGVLAKSSSYKSLRAYWYRRLAEIAWMMTSAPEKDIKLLQGQASELKQQIQQITVLAATGNVDEMILNDETDRPSKKIEEVNTRLRSENATMETEVKEAIVEQAEDKLDST